MAQKKSTPRDTKAQTADADPKRIQKILAHASFNSRRTYKVLIQKNRIKIDGQIVTKLNAKTDIETQKLHIDNKTIKPKRPIYYLLNKPKSTLCTLSDPKNRRTMQDHLPDEHRQIFPIDRLNMDSRGAMILTNNGRFTNLLTHPHYNIEKTYLARVRNNVNNGTIGKLHQSVHLAKSKTLPTRIWIIKRKAEETKLGIAISEGKNRQMRRMLATVGYKYQTLTHTRIGPLTLKGLRKDDFRELSANEVQELERIAKRNSGAPPPPWARGRASRTKAKGKPDPSLLHEKQERARKATTTIKTTNLAPRDNAKPAQRDNAKPAPMPRKPTTPRTPRPDIISNGNRPWQPLRNPISQPRAPQDDERHDNKQHSDHHSPHPQHEKQNY